MASQSIKHQHEHKHKLCSCQTPTKLHSEIEKKLITYCCISCKRMFIKEKIREIKTTTEINHPIFCKLNVSHFPAPYYICRQQCYISIYINNENPAYSHLNNMQIHDTPNELKCLNIYETLLTQRAKCFLSMVNLRTHTKFVGANLVKALKGIAIHMPITFDATHDYLEQSLPSAEAFHILINGLPTKSHNIWRSLVDLDKVYKAINWLVVNNPYYSAVTINQIQNTETALLFSDNDDTKNNQNVSNGESSYLTQFNDINLVHYSVIDLDKNNINAPDIAKYSCKRVCTAPLTNRDKDLDHLCFHQLFPYGRGGMYDDRPQKVQPAMYARWILRQYNPVARRNAQYIFSLLHN